MPFIDAKITTKLTPDKKEQLKAEFGKTMALLGKSESYLMVGINDGYDLWLGGNKIENGAYVAVSLLGDAGSAAYNKVTAAICDLLKSELDTDGKNVYITYHPTANWGWNGSNF